MMHVEAQTAPRQTLSPHGRRSSVGSPAGGPLPAVFWPIVAMVTMVPVLAFLLVALFT